jgi:hypothetical protein
MNYSGLLEAIKLSTTIIGVRLLIRRTRHRTVGTEHATIARLGFQQRAAMRAFVKELARV